VQRDGTDITDMALCDFRPIYEYLEEERAKKKALTSAEKKELKAEKDKLEEPFAYCQLNGRKEKVGNFRVEPPGLFRGRGEHPKKGSLKVCRLASCPAGSHPTCPSQCSTVYGRKTSLSISVKVCPHLNPTFPGNGRTLSTIRRSLGWPLGRRTSTAKISMSSSQQPVR
jgi:hypothetical protein